MWLSGGAARERCKCGKCGFSGRRCGTFTLGPVRALGNQHRSQCGDDFDGQREHAGAVAIDESRRFHGRVVRALPDRGVDR